MKKPFVSIQESSPKDKDLSKPNTMKDFYIVEKILDKKLLDGQWKYKVKWLNYSIAQSTWEPKENLNNVSLMLKYFDENFEKNQKAKDVANITKPLVSNTSSSSPERSASSSEEEEENKNTKLRSSNKNNNSILNKNNSKNDSSLNNNHNNVNKNKPTLKKRGRKPRQIKEKTRKKKNTLVLRYFNKIWRTIYDLHKKYSFSSDDEEAFENDSSARSLMEKSFESEAHSEDDSSFSYKKEQKKKLINYGGPSKKIKGEERGRGRPRKYPLNPSRMELEEENSDEKSESQEKKEKIKSFSPKNSSKIKEDKPSFNKAMNMEHKINKPEIVSKEKEKEKSLQLIKNAIELNEEKDVSLLSKPSKSIEPFKENAIPTNDKNINQQEIIVLDKPLPEYGDISIGDKPKQIISATPGLLGDEVICLVEWLPRNDGTIPKRSKVSNQILKKYDVGLLVSFYESKLRFNQAKNKEIEKKDNSSALKTNKETIDNINNSNINNNNIINSNNKDLLSENNKNMQEIVNENNNNQQTINTNDDHKNNNHEIFLNSNNNNDHLNSINYEVYAENVKSSCNNENENEKINKNNNNNSIESTINQNSENKNVSIVSPSLENKTQNEKKVMNIVEEEKKSNEITEKEVEKDSKKKKDIASIIAELVEKSKNTN